MRKPWIFILCLGLGAHSWAATVVLCPRFIIEDHSVGFKDTEKKLICGDPKNEAWKDIPDSQAIFNLRTFLQDRGYYHAQVTQRDGKNYIRIGETTKVSEFNVVGEPLSLDYTRLRKIKGETLTPTLLDEIKSRLMKVLRANGYPCPEIDMHANPNDGVVTATLKPGPLQTLIEVNEEPIPGLKTGIMGRYDAFKLGATYNADYLSTTVQRILESGTVQSTYFFTQCTADGAVAQQKFVAGPPRLLTLGVGIDTERLLLFRAGWKNARMGPNGSILDLVLNASLRDQELTAASNWYVFGRSRWYLRPAVQLRHENLGPSNSPTETVTAKVQFGPAMTWDAEHIGGSFLLGPILNVTHTVRGRGPKLATFLSLGTEARVTSHYFEFYRNSPQRGFDLKFEGNSSLNNALSNFSGQLLRLNFEYLWNVGNFDPPWLVAGIRARVATTVTEEKVHEDRLTPEFRHFFGGSPDMRGFSLKELPGDDRGALTGIYLGTELRFADLLPWGLQPFVFFDVGMMGRKHFSLEKPVFYSPGLGIRWQSKIGVIRTSLAHGFLSNTLSTDPQRSHLQFYFSFGEEF